MLQPSRTSPPPSLTESIAGILSQHDLGEQEHHAGGVAHHGLRCPGVQDCGNVMKWVQAGDENCDR